MRIHSHKKNVLRTKTWPDLSRDRERDYEKLRGDWEDVGRFIRESTESYGRAQG